MSTKTTFYEFLGSNIRHLKRFHNFNGLQRCCDKGRANASFAVAIGNTILSFLPLAWRRVGPGTTPRLSDISMLRHRLYGTEAEKILMVLLPDISMQWAGISTNPARHDLIVPCVRCVRVGHTERNMFRVHQKVSSSHLRLPSKPKATNHIASSRLTRPLLRMEIGIDRSRRASKSPS